MLALLGLLISIRSQYQRKLSLYGLLIIILVQLFIGYRMYLTMNIEVKMLLSCICNHTLGLVNLMIAAQYYCKL